MVGEVVSAERWVCHIGAMTTCRGRFHLFTNFELYLCVTFSIFPTSIVHYEALRSLYIISFSGLGRGVS